MDQNNHNTSADFMVKRKRGRPRKHFKPDDSNYHSPPGFSKSHQQHQSLQNEAMVGQYVTGMIEATCEDGFVLAVKVGGSDNMLRGVVFKPGHFHPVSTGNDVAPHVPMIRRNNDVGDHHVSEAQGGRKSRLHEKRGAKASVPVPIQPKLPTVPSHLMAPFVHMQTEIESQVSGASNGLLTTQVMEKGHDHNESEEQALSIEPLQAIHPVHPIHIPKPMPSYGRGNNTT